MGKILANQSSLAQTEIETHYWEDNDSPQGDVATIVRVMPSNWERTNETRELASLPAAIYGSSAT
jgi:hypothetical protein